MKKWTQKEFEEIDDTMESEFNQDIANNTTEEIAGLVLDYPKYFSDEILKKAKLIQLEGKLRKELVENTPLVDLEIKEEKEGNISLTLNGEDWTEYYGTNFSDDLYSEIIQELYDLIVEQEEKSGRIANKNPEWYDETSEDELRDYAQEFFGDISSIVIDIENNKILLRCSYKTGDGIDKPYNDTPVGKEVTEAYEKAGFEVEYEKTMIYSDGSEEAKWIYGNMELKFTSDDTVETVKDKIKTALEKGQSQWK